VRRAGLLALRENLGADIVRLKHFEAALTETRASVSLEMEREYEKIAETLKQESPGERRIGFAISQNDAGAKRALDLPVVAELQVRDDRR
jgi:hypothetical protein